ncbi:MAG: signal peptidase I [Acidobacteriota bacterium]
MHDDITQKMKLKKKSTFREYAEALLIAALIAFTIRAFAFEAFKIPSGSMLPTLSIGDHIFVNKFEYGLRAPFTKYRFIKRAGPDRGDVIVFIYPVDEGKDFIKRAIGIPGDKVRLEGTDVFINGKKLDHKPVTVKQDPANKRRLIIENGTIRHVPYVRGWENFDFFEESINGHSHIVQYDKFMKRPNLEFEVPEEKYLALGDNRDNSADSREWGFVPMDNIKGEAMFVWLSIDRDQGGIRWKEFGRWVE